jgi:hypothetical protein
MGLMKDFYEYLSDKFAKGETDWNPAEHKDWELPPVKLFKEYLELLREVEA